MHKVLIIHRKPLEFYPPVTNMILFLEKNSYEVQVVTCFNDKNRKNFVPDLPNTLIKRIINVKYGFIKKIINEFTFALKCSKTTRKMNAQSIFYYETESSLGAFLSVLFRPRIKLVNVNHEYLSPSWYKLTATLFTKVLHKLEITYLYKRCIFIGQTNQQRKDLFLKDYKFLIQSKIQLLPNYPLSNWQSSAIVKVNELNLTKRFVLVGAVSYDFSYVKEFCEWIENQKGKALFDIYSYMIEGKTYEYLKKSKFKHVNFHEEGIEYYMLPNTLKQYDFGVVLYKGTTLNYQFNVPNKVFEYLACGLQVWVSDKLTSTNIFTKENDISNITLVDFQKLDSMEIENISSANTKNMKDFFCENVFFELLEKIKAN